MLQVYALCKLEVTEEAPLVSLQQMRLLGLFLFQDKDHRKLLVHKRGSTTKY